MVLVNAPSICVLVFLLIGLGDAGKKQKNDKIIIHVPYKIHHHHYQPQVKYVKIPEIKTQLIPEEILKPEFTKPIAVQEPLINQTSEPFKKERKQKKLKKILKRKPKTTQIPPSPLPSFPLETFLGLDKILGDQITKQNVAAPIPLPVRLPSKPKDYQFSDGTDYKEKKPKQLQITSYAFTTLRHNKPQLVVESKEKLKKPKSERSLDENPDYEHVGYILVPKNQNSQYTREY